MTVRQYKDVIVKKPWGYEYLCYQNEELAIWILQIDQYEKTSFHCHPNKNTGFIVLKGEVELSFMRHSLRLSTLDKIHIFRARFHSTQALSKDGAIVLEIETPEDKTDLVRLHDEYGREGQEYESRNYEIPKHADCVWIPEPVNNSSAIEVGECRMTHISPKAKEDLYGASEKDCFIVARGGIVTSNYQKIIWPGDVIDGVSLEKLLKAFDLVVGTTFIKVTT